MNRRQSFKEIFDALKVGAFSYAAMKYPIIGAASKPGQICIVLDDAGGNKYTHENLVDLIKADIPITTAVMPFEQYEKKFLETLIEEDKKNVDLLLHQPMQYTREETPKDQDWIKIYASTKPYEVPIILNGNLEHLYGLINIKGIIKGVNNHQGSLVTQDKNLMVEIAEFCYKNPRHGKLIVCDSRTTEDSQLYASAQEIGSKIKNSKYFQRTWDFIDNDNPTKEEVLEELNKCYQDVLNGKSHVLIGHITKPQTVQAVIEFYQQNKKLIDKYKILVKISDLKMF